MNNVILIGRLTRDPELRYLSNGTAVTRFSLAVDKDLSKEKKKEFEDKGQPTVDFINIVVWRKQAENCANYLLKGRLIAVQGRIQSGSYEKGGSRIYTTDVVAEKVQFLEYGEKKTNQQNYQQSDFSYDGFSPAEDDSDIPF